MLTEAIEAATTEQLVEMFRASISDDSAAARMVRACIAGVYEDRNGEDSAEFLRDELLAARRA